MKAASFFLLAVLLVASSAATDSGFTTAKVLAIKKHANGRIAYWESRVPIFDYYPVYDITLKVGDKKYMVRYESVTLISGYRVMTKPTFRDYRDKKH
jgi:hypothetical protein